MRTLVVALFAVVASLFAAPPTASAAAPVTKRLAVVIIQNGDTAAEQTQLADTAFLRNVFLGSTNSLATWMSTVTRGQLTFTPAGAGVFSIPPSEELRDADKTGCHTNLATTTAESHLKSLGVTYDSLAIVFDIAACGWGGLGQVPGRLTWYPPRPSLAAIVHELGHNQGYPHESKQDCPSGNMASCHGKGECCSNNTPMGGGGSERGYSSVELLHSGWIDAGAKVLATKPGNFSLKPLYSTEGTRVVEYKVSSALSYVIETRAPAGGVDNAINNPGVRVYKVSNADYRNAVMVNPGSGYLPSGASITDEASKLKISVRSSSPSGATVAISTLGAPPSASPSPSPSPSPSESPTPAPEDLIPDQISDLLGSTPIPPADPGVSLGRVLLLALLPVVFLLGVTIYVLRRTRRRPKHR